MYPILQIKSPKIIASIDSNSSTATYSKKPYFGQIVGVRYKVQYQLNLIDLYDKESTQAQAA